LIAPFRIGDALRCMLVDAPSGTNRAAPTESVVRCRPLRNSTLWRQSLARSSNRVTVGDWNGMALASLASARVRTGVRAWEVDRLHLKEPAQALELLEQIVTGVGSRGAERVFLRVACDSPIVDVARRVGFFPYYEEIHLTGSEWLPETDSSDRDDTRRFTSEARLEPDQQGLFQLYCAATPQRVREGTGVTIDQWCDSQEPARTHRSETVLKLDGKIVGWGLRERQYHRRTNDWAPRPPGDHDPSGPIVLPDPELAGPRLSGTHSWAFGPARPTGIRTLYYVNQDCCSAD